MGPLKHTVASGVVSLGFAWLTKSVPGTMACFLSGIFIDLDHVLDYWLSKRKMFFTYKELFSFCAYEKKGRLFLLLHAYEWLIAFWLVIGLYQLNLVWVGLAVGLSAHLLLDQIFNPLRPFVYFFCYRLKHRFHKKCVFPENYYKQLV